MMTDGKSLEHLGVDPDEVMLPKLADLESGSDPVLAQAAQELGIGVPFSSEYAAGLFPYEWPEE